MWLFASIVLILAVYHPGFRKLVLWLAGAGIGIAVILLLAAAIYGP